MTPQEVIETFRNMKPQLERIAKTYDELYPVDQSAEEKYITSIAVQIADKAYDIHRLINWVNKPVVAEGPLYKNKFGRYELNGHDGLELTCGHPVDIWDTEDSMYRYTQIEHSGDYYAVVLGKDVPLDGVYARLRG